MTFRSWLGLHAASAIVAAFALCLTCTHATAHGRGSGGPNSGIPIPSLGHGEMAVLAPFHGQIVALASDAADTNENFRRILNFAQIQYVYCGWGLVPGSIRDEDSAFNECSHAYLAATKAILLSMRSMAAEKNRAENLISELDRLLVVSGLSFITCQFSGETFNTADIVKPSLEGLARNPAIAGPFLIIIGLPALLYARRKRANRADGIITKN